MSRNIEQRHGKIAQQLKCALRICRNLLIRHQTTLNFASRFLARFASPIAQRPQQPQCPASVNGTTLLAEKHFVVITQESELEADVSDTWGCLAPYYLLSGFVADFRLCQQFTFRFTFGSLVRLGLALSRLPVPSLSADVRGT